MNSFEIVTFFNDSFPVEFLPFGRGCHNAYVKLSG